MIRTALSCLVLCTAIAGAPPAAAQLAPGYSGFSTAPTSASEAEYWDMMVRMGSCLARQKQAESVALVSSVIDSEAEAGAYGELFDRNRNLCMGQFVRATFVRSYVRGVVAEGLVEDLDDEAFARLVASPPAAPEQIANLHELASCYVVSNPEEAREFLKRTKLQTEGELAFLQNIATNIAPCVPEGRDIDLDPIDIRLAIAEALYRAATGLGPAQIKGRE